MRQVRRKFQDHTVISFVDHVSFFSSSRRQRRSRCSRRRLRRHPGYRHPSLQTDHQKDYQDHQDHRDHQYLRWASSSFCDGLQRVGEGGEQGSLLSKWKASCEMVPRFFYLYFFVNNIENRVVEKSQSEKLISITSSHHSRP